MTVLNDTQPYEQYTGNGTWQYFEYGFEMLEDSTVYVLVDGVPAVFTQQDNGVVIDPPPPLGSVINIYRYTDITQLRDWQTFESFDADKTEGALDKLILLKQEAAVYRALMNLYALHELPSVTIVNDKGTDATIFYWNEEMAGVFGGEVTMKMPNAGAVVEKPEDFAYFQYGNIPVFTQTLTSTLYPIQTTDGIQVTMTLDGGVMQDIRNDELDYTHTILSGELKVIKLSHGPDVDELDYTHTILSGELKQILLSYGPDTDELDYTHTILSGALETILIRANSPDEGIITTVTLDSANCSMTDA